LHVKMEVDWLCRKHKFDERGSPSRPQVFSPPATLPEILSKTGCKFIFRNLPRTKGIPRYFRGKFALIAGTPSRTPVKSMLSHLMAATEDF
jgi:hypothetical protein